VFIHIIGDLGLSMAVRVIRVKSPSYLNQPETGRQALATMVMEGLCCPLCDYKSENEYELMVTASSLPLVHPFES
jgi:hypothetical protein